MDAWLRFTGIIVSLSDTLTADAALTRLSAFTDVGELAQAAEPGGIHLRFVPSGFLGQAR